jgi:hypothetical protein
MTARLNRVTFKTNRTMDFSSEDELEKQTGHTKFEYHKDLFPKSTRMQFVADEKSLLPWVVEAAFGWLGKDAPNERKIVTGANWSAAIKNPFRSFGATGEGVETFLSNFYATHDEPVVIVLHLACPRIAYTNRGKSEFAIGDDNE